MDKSYITLFFELPELLKKEVCSSVEEKEDWGKDYLSKNRNIEKYIYEACEVIQIVGISYTKYERDISQYTNKELNEGMGEVCGRNYELEVRLAYRRILELFIESYNFSKIKNNNEKVFRHFYLIKNLKSFFSRENNFQKFCNLSSDFDLKVISEIRKEIRTLDIQNTFYLSDKKDYEKDSDIIHLFKSYSKLFEKTVLEMSYSQKLATQESYQSYVETSEVIHGYSGGPKFNLENYHQEILNLYIRIFLISKDIIKQLSLIGSNIIHSQELLDSIGQLKADISCDFIPNINDIVLVKNEIKARIIEISTSTYGVKKYKVLYTDKSGNFTLSFEQEWFLLKDLKKITYNPLIKDEGLTKESSLS